MQARITSYTNPVLDDIFPDPTVIRASNGAYFAYGTQIETPGESVNVQVAVSTDLVNWRLLGDALPRKAPWASQTQTYWAPHVHPHGDRY